MKHLMFVVVAVVVIVSLVVLTSDKDKTKILNAFAEQERGVPEWVEVDWKNDHSSGVSYQITYGLGGRKCHSIVEFNTEGHMEEKARRCDF